MNKTQAKYYLVLPHELTLLRTILNHSSRWIWHEIPDMHRMLSMTYALHDFQAFKVQHAYLAARGFLECRAAHDRRTNLHQWRLTEEAAKMLIAPRRGRVIARAEKPQLRAA